MPDSLTPDEVLREIVTVPEGDTYVRWAVVGHEETYVDDLANQLLACREALRPLAEAWIDYSSGEIVLGELLEDAVIAAKACLPEYDDEQ